MNREQAVTAIAEFLADCEQLHDVIMECANDVQNAEDPAPRDADYTDEIDEARLEKLHAIFSDIRLAAFKRIVAEG